MMTLDVPGSVTNSQITVALLDLNDLLRYSSVRPHGLNEVLGKDAVPDWLVNLAAVVVTRTSQVDIMADTIIRLSKKATLPLPLMAAITQMPGWTDYIYWAEDGKLLSPYREQVQVQYPELDGLPLGLLLETLASQPVRDWTGQVPDMFIADVRYILAKVRRLEKEG